MWQLEVRHGAATAAKWQLAGDDGNEFDSEREAWQEAGKLLLLGELYQSSWYRLVDIEKKTATLGMRIVMGPGGAVRLMVEEPGGRVRLIDVTTLAAEQRS